MGFRGRQFIDKNAISSELNIFVEDMNFQVFDWNAELSRTKSQLVSKKFEFNLL